MSSVISALGKAKDSPLYGLLATMYNQIEKRNSANESYKQIRLLLEDLLARGYSYETVEIQTIVEMLKELPAYGANTRNFTKLYLRDEYGLRKLPKDPTRIPKGHWH
ncbi:hypothetical protein LL266_10175 [Vibrio anguillarum]|uniref:Uncharacterized protein n=1 Tax=Vibrio nigripulchritudo TaxID=28173 RepID=U4KIK3_9VIBR|nr:MULTISPECIES: hypothetical protein [Vibrio]MCC4236872.1 hypothetical protein [Vibrio anguillarum]MDT3845739.1 hypothetical protein [Vibrio anguillarum]CCN89239.1 Conserved hypothetical protein [Vibrio nigripulchritudo SFn27]CCO41708.1 Conserved hypothetical protein [Vibrio nigripulchritudo SFn135]CCO60830.1 Conserved hypothetical protein [Vibrio nigripulchritudo]